MKRTQKAAIAVSCLVVAGLGALAAPPIIATTSWASGLFAPVAVATASPSATPTAAPTDGADDLPADLPEGYVDVGHGTFIPAGGPGDCKASAYIWIGSDSGEPMRVSMEGAELVDTGPREFAVGEVGLDEQGRPATYTVASGDVVTRIGDRFCIYNGGMLDLLNGYSHGAVIQPGDVLTLNADLITDWVDPYADE